MFRISILITALGLTLSACSEGSIDSALGTDNVNNSVTEAAPAAANERPTTAAVKPRWRTLAELKGSSDKQTKPFRVNSPEWRITWETEPTSKEEEFFIFLYETGYEDEPIIIATNPSNDVAEMEAVNGEFYLEVRAKQPYRVDIKEYK